MSKNKVRIIKDDVPCLAYGVAAVSFIPLIGIPFGLSSIVWGISKWRTGGKNLVWLGSGGIVLTIVLYSSIAFTGMRIERTGVFDSQKEKLSITQLHMLLPVIEYFKLQHDKYPASLDELREQTNFPLNFIDMTQIRFFPSSNEPPRMFYYELDVSGDYYYLLGVGPDGQPFTADDILPDVSADEMNKIGYRVKTMIVP